jgi:hypothetical protein
VLSIVRSGAPALYSDSIILCSTYLIEFSVRDFNALSVDCSVLFLSGLVPWRSAILQLQIFNVSSLSLALQSQLLVFFPYRLLSHSLPRHLVLLALLVTLWCHINATTTVTLLLTCSGCLTAGSGSVFFSDDDALRCASDSTVCLAQQFIYPWLRNGCWLRSWAWEWDARTRTFWASQNGLVVPAILIELFSILIH